MVNFNSGMNQNYFLQGFSSSFQYSSNYATQGAYYADQQGQDPIVAIMNGIGAVDNQSIYASALPFGQTNYAAQPYAAAQAPAFNANPMMQMMQMMMQMMQVCFQMMTGQNAANGAFAGANADPNAAGNIFGNNAADNNQPLNGNLAAPAVKPADISDADWAKIKQLDPKMQGAVTELYKRAHEKGLDFHIGSGFRTNAEQQRLYRTARPGYAAKPGTSQHEFGKAVDIQASAATKQALGQIWQSMGFMWGGTWKNTTEDWHFDLRPA